MSAGSENSANAQSWDVILIGAGLGGLTCAAYLARKGKRVLLLEQAKTPGGPCRTLEVQGTQFSVGTNTFGKHCERMLKELKIDVSFEPAPLCLSYAGAQVYFPFRTSLLSAARKMGVKLSEVVRLLFHINHAKGGVGKTYAEAVNSMTRSEAIRELLFAESWSIGTPPDILSAKAFEVFFDHFYGYQNPIAPVEGAQAIPDALVRNIELYGGQIRYGTQVTQLIARPEGGWRVQSEGADWIAPQVISNLPPKATLQLLRNVSPSLQNAPYVRKTEQQRPALSFALMLIKLDRNSSYETQTKDSNHWRRSTLILSSPVVSTLRTLEEGWVPEKPIINVVGPSASSQLIQSQELPLTILTLWPRDGKNSLKEKMQKAMMTVLEDEWPGFSNSVNWTELITPSEYSQRMGGVSSCPAHAMENHESKLSFDWPIPGLFSVGTSVGPHGTHAAAAMESGRQCARFILSRS